MEEIMAQNSSRAKRSERVVDPGKLRAGDYRLTTADALWGRQF
jgi:hypothetical protein